MPMVKLNLDYTTNEPLPEYAEALKNGEVVQGKIIEVAAVPDGTVSKKPTVGFITQLPDGKYVWAEITLAMMQTLNAGLRGRYGEM